MTRRRWGLATLGLVLLVWILGGEWVSIHHQIQDNHFIDALGGLSFLAASLAALDRRPGNMIGPLMTAYVLVDFLGNWGNLQVPVLPLLGVSAGQLATGVILAHIALSYPAGRLQTGFDRAVTGLIYAAAIACCAVIVLVYDPRSAGCTECAWEPAPFPSRATFLAATSVYQRAGSVLVLLFFAALWRRFQRATPAERRDLSPLG